MSESFDPREFSEQLTKVVYHVFGGWHHVKYKENTEYMGRKGVQISVSDDLSTYDFDQLTKLVIACHQWSVRASICSGGPRRLSIWLHEREPADYENPKQCFWERHPTSDHLIAAVQHVKENHP